MKRISLWMVALTALLAVSAPAKEIKGQVFVVTQAGTNIKLALAKVFVVSPAGVEKAKTEGSARIKAINTWAENYIADLKRDIERAQNMSGITAGEFLGQLEKNRKEHVSIYAEKLKLAISEPPDGLDPETLTDADGMFELSAPTDAFLFIHAERIQPRETYRWVLPVAELVPSSGKILVSNHNLFEGPVEKLNR